MKMYICGINEYRNILNMLNRKRITHGNFNVTVSFFTNKHGVNGAKIVVG